MTNSEKLDQHLKIVDKYHIKTDKEKLTISYTNPESNEIYVLNCEDELGVDNIKTFLIKNLIYAENHK